MHKISNQLFILLANVFAEVREHAVCQDFQDLQSLLVDSLQGLMAATFFAKIFLDLLRPLDLHR